MSEKFHPFKDMLENAKAQHQVDKANFAAAKAESKAVWEEAKLSPKARLEKMQRERDIQLEEANKRIAAAEERIAAARESKEN